MHTLCPCSQNPQSLVFTERLFIDLLEIPGRDSTDAWQESMLTVLEREVDYVVAFV